MSAELPNAEIFVPHRGCKPAFRVVIAYDDFAAGRRAMDACKLLISQLGAEVQFRSGMWTFDLLRNRRLSEMAVGDAIEADMVMVASGESEDLPEEVKDWIEAWAPRKRGQTSALVALLDAPVDAINGASLAHAFLKQAAATAGMDFLPQALPLAETPGLFPDRNFPRPAPEGWGLND